MAQHLLETAAEEVDTAKEALTDQDARDRLTVLASHLRSQAGRETTPALGTLDRIHAKLRDIEQHIDDTTATEAIERARDNIMAFLDTLDDRGMTQHGSTQPTDSSDRA